MSLALTMCWCCDRLLELGAGQGLAPGDLSVCYQCGAILMITADLGTEEPSADVYVLLENDPELRERYMDKLRDARDARARAAITRTAEADPLPSSSSADTGPGARQPEPEVSATTGGKT